MKTVLVLCSGNACRSQMAEGYLHYYASDKAVIYSAGLESHGLNPLATEVMGEDSIDISNHTSKTLSDLGIQHFDYLITICDEAREQLPDNVSYDCDYHFSIPDPAKISGAKEKKLQGFRQVRELIKISILKFIGRELIDRAEPVLS